MGIDAADQNAIRMKPTYFTYFLVLYEFNELFYISGGAPRRSITT